MASQKFSFSYTTKKKTNTSNVSPSNLFRKLSCVTFLPDHSSPPSHHTHTHMHTYTHTWIHTHTHACLSFTRINKYTQPLQQSFIWPGFNSFLISVTLLSKCDPFCLPLLWCVAQKQHYTANLYWVNPKDLFYLLSAMAYSPSIYRAGAQALVCPLNFILHLWASPSFHRIFFP